MTALASLLWTCDETYFRGGKTILLMARDQEWSRDWDPIAPSKAYPHMTQRPQKVPSWRFYHVPTEPSVGGPLTWVLREHRVSNCFSSLPSHTWPLCVFWDILFGIEERKAGLNTPGAARQMALCIAVPQPPAPPAACIQRHTRATSVLCPKPKQVRP